MPRRATAARSLSLLLLALIAAVGIRPSWAAENSLYQPSYLEYRVAWNGIPAARATVRIATEDLAGDVGYVVETTVETNSFIDIFYQYRGSARTTFLADGLIPLHFTYQQRINSVPAIMWIDFDHTSHRAESVRVKKGKRKTHEADASVFVDPITAAFRFRGTDPIGEPMSQFVFTGEKYYEVTLSPVGNEVIDVPAGRFNALMLEPRVLKVKKKNRPHGKLRRATIWVTDDPTHMILRIRSEVFIGSVSVDLVRMGEPPAEPASEPDGETVKAGGNPVRQSRPGGTEAAALHAAR